MSKCPPCVTCDWWVQQDRPLRTMHGDYAICGQCRKDSPIVANVDGKVISRWPLTRDTEFCGRHSDLEPVGAGTSVF